VGLLLTKTSSFLWPAKDDLKLTTPYVYTVPCECVEAYIGHTGRPIETRTKERQCHIRLKQSEKSHVAEHSINLGHRIKLQDTSIFSAKATCM
jgi:hypothetical protein